MKITITTAGRTLTSSIVRQMPEATTDVIRLVTHENQVLGHVNHTKCSYYIIRVFSFYYKVEKMKTPWEECSTPNRYIISGNRQKYLSSITEKKDFLSGYAKIETLGTLLIYL